MLPVPCFYTLEHVPEKLTDFSDQNMLQGIDSYRSDNSIRSEYALALRIRWADLS
jgi:hypothetical protein